MGERLRLISELESASKNESNENFKKSFFNCNDLKPIILNYNFIHYIDSTYKHVSLKL